ncbi:hypothetical protein JMJ77_0001727 [Colletotrichum scovillei]|uniref:Uncharacterized protein n=1 Tax=Colletotrichum scovillei TaxID=1209932 RepID=A0A9P7R6J2_9PEZI|nr:hypothetical protein JMJ77_0001727 [Colletotrichum scovillei]KAG7070135.1 hypothetical protein JMJ76_0001392 [Colletotrichum scovillei]KAG7078420.1 hypothetical protein JMJ78_0002092 [Colletotrichum scovillei]
MLRPMPAEIFGEELRQPGARFGRESQHQTYRSKYINRARKLTR